MDTLKLSRHYPSSEYLMNVHKNARLTAHGRKRATACGACRSRGCLPAHGRGDPLYRHDGVLGPPWFPAASAVRLFCSV
jgi:hypothetical protein